MSMKSITHRTDKTAYHVDSGSELPSLAMEAAQEMGRKGAGGFTVIAGMADRELAHIRFGPIEPDTQYPIASASKWLTAATALRVIEEHQCSLDAPISTFLPSMSGAAAELTLRQLLSQTSGLAGSNGERYDLAQDHRMTLLQSAEEVTARPLISEPGEVFAYGGPGFQVVGAIVEALTSKKWAAVFDEMIARPLGMTRTYWTHLKLDTTKELPPDETLNPVLQGGAVSTASDCARFLRMLAQGGVFERSRLLSQESIDLMLRDQTPHAYMTATDESVLPDAHYSLGSWCETWDSDGVCNRNSSVGLFGVYPWVEKNTRRYGLIFVCQREDAFRLWPEMEIIRDSLVTGWPG